MFDGGLRGFFDDVVNTVRCIGADVAYKKSQLRRMYYQQFCEEDETEAFGEHSEIKNGIKKFMELKEKK